MIKKLGFKKINVILIIITLSITTIFIIGKSQVNNIKYYNHIDNNNFSITYRYISGFPEYSNKETIISNKGSYLIKIYLSNGEIQNIEGIADIEEIKAFLKYALRKNIKDMSDDMVAKDTDGGSTKIIDIRIGDTIIKAGGYMPEYVSKDFKSILEKLNTIIDIY